MDLGIVILISKFPNLCHDMKAYPRIWCMNAYPIVQLSYLQCPGDIIISDFGRRISYHVIKLTQSNYISVINVTMIDVSSIKADVSKDFGVHGL